MKYRLIITLLIAILFTDRVRSDEIRSQFKGTWAIRTPEAHAGETVTFINQGITLKATMPDPFGNVSLTDLSEAHGSADFILSGETSGARFNCYYGLTVVSDSSMSWSLKDGSSKICGKFGNINWITTLKEALAPPKVSVVGPVALQPGHDMNLPVELDKPGSVDVFLDQVNGSNGSSPELAIRICSAQASVNNPCPHHQIGAPGVASQALPAGLANVEVFNFGVNPEVTLRLRIRSP